MEFPEQMRASTERNPLLTITADKYKVRSYVREKLGGEESEKSRFEPVSYDFELGSYWKADANGYSLKGYLPGR